MTDAARAAAYRNEIYHRIGLRFVDPGKAGPILDDNNNLLPQFTDPLFPRPSDLEPDSAWNDGSEMQYLKPYGPFPYGVTPVALGYNYAKRSQVAMTVGGQRPLQISDTVVDSRPGLLLKQWGEEESDRGVTDESRAFGLFRETDAHALELVTAPITPEAKVVNPHALAAAIYEYQMSARLSADSLKEYERHLSNPQYVNPYQSYTSHLEELRALMALATADNAYMASFAPGADRSTLLKTASENYRKARASYERMVLRYSTEEAVVGPLIRNTRTDIDRISTDDLHALFLKALTAVQALPKNQREYDEQREDYASYIQRADARLRMLAAYDAPSLLQIR